MTPRKHGTWYLPALVVPLLALAMFMIGVALKRPLDDTAHADSLPFPGGAVNKDNSSGQDHGGNEPTPDGSTAEIRGRPRTRPLSGKELETGSADIIFDLRSVTGMRPDPAVHHELRVEERALSVTIPELYRSDSTSPPETLRFPLFDGRSVLLKSLRHQPMGTGQGVLFAEADGEPQGGHVLLSYVGPALAGMIHLPARGEFYEIRTAPNGSSHILTQLDPDKMPACGTCVQHQGK